MNSTDDRDLREQKQSGSWKEPQKQNDPGERTFSESDSSSKSREDSDESVDNEKKPARQMTGGPNKPTA